MRRIVARDSPTASINSRSARGTPTQSCSTPDHCVTIHKMPEFYSKSSSSLWVAVKKLDMSTYLFLSPHLLHARAPCSSSVLSCLALTSGRPPLLGCPLFCLNYASLHNCSRISQWPFLLPFPTRRSFALSQLGWLQVKSSRLSRQENVFAIEEEFHHVEKNELLGSPRRRICRLGCLQTHLPPRRLRPVPLSPDCLFDGHRIEPCISGKATSCSSQISGFMTKFHIQKYVSRRE